MIAATRWAKQGKFNIKNTGCDKRVTVRPKAMPRKDRLRSSDLLEKVWFSHGAAGRWLLVPARPELVKLLDQP